MSETWKWSSQRVFRDYSTRPTDDVVEKLANLECFVFFFDM